MDNSNKKNDEQAVKEFEDSQNKKIFKGKIIIITITIVNIATSILTAIVNLNILTLIVGIALSIALLSGMTWVRYLFAVGALLNVFNILWLLTDTSELDTVTVIILLICLVYSVAGSIILFKSKSVSEYMYVRKNG